MVPFHGVMVPEGSSDAVPWSYGASSGIPAETFAFHDTPPLVLIFHLGAA